MLIRWFLAFVAVTPAFADFDPSTCQPLAAGNCAFVEDDFAVNDGDLMVRQSTPSILFHDREATDTDDNASIDVTCTDATSAAEDCDVTITQQEAGVAKNVLVADADGGITVGSANNNSFTVTSDSTGDGEVVLPAASIGSAELSTDIAASNITDVTRSIPLPIGSWVPCAGTVAGIWDSSGADAEPDLAANPAGHMTIVYDDTGGSIDTDTICNSFTVPADYASGGSFRARVTQDAATTNIETFSCAISVDGAAAGAANAGNNVSQTAVQAVTSTPTGTWAAGASIQVACSQGNASADDTVYFHGIEARYTATQ